MTRGWSVSYKTWILRKWTAIKGKRQRIVFCNKMHMTNKSSKHAYQKESHRLILLQACSPLEKPFLTHLQKPWVPDLTAHSLNRERKTQCGDPWSCFAENCRYGSVRSGHLGPLGFYETQPDPIRVDYTKSILIYWNNYYNYLCHFLCLLSISVPFICRSFG